jgi:deazaflavin-dependent oxidoreductase (nitroreductase family)
MAETPDTDGIKAMNVDVVAQFRTNGGKVGGQFEGADIVLLHTTGAKSGKQRMIPLVYATVDDKMLVIGSYGGADVDPAWVKNLRANPNAHVEVGTESYDVIARELPGAERDPAFAKIVELAPGFGDYQKNTTRIIPLFDLQRV